MARIIDLHIADTPIAGVTNLEPKLPAINWESDWAKSRDVADDAVLAYRPAPFDAPQTVRFSATKIANVYAKTPVDPAYQLPFKRGLSILAQVNLVATVTDDEDPTYRVDLPLSAHLVIKAPLSGLITVANVRTVAERALALIYAQGVVDDSRITDLLKEVMVPDGV